MRRKEVYLAIFIWLLLTVSFTVPNSVNFANNITDQVKSAALETHSLISITGNSELDDFCSGNGTDGLTLETAHVIEGYEIQPGDSDSAITITDTDRFLIIRNVTTVLGNGGIHLSNAGNVTVTMCNLIDHSEDGIWLENSQNINITGNYIMNNSYGIYFSSDSANNFITKNVVNNNSDTGMLLSSTSNNFLSNNTVAFSGGSGIIIESSNNNTISGNNASYNSEQGINLYETFNNNISNNTASFQNDGIWIEISGNDTIIGNNVSYNSNDGIYVELTENSMIIGNNASYNRIGVEDYESNNTVISGNWLTYNSYSGISMWGGDSGNNNTYTGNNIANNGGSSYGYGIELDDKCTNNTIRENNISNNDDHGIYITDRSNDNTISGNNISANLGSGISLSVNSTRNMISRNNFIDQSNEHVYVHNSDNNIISYNLMNGTSNDALYSYESNSTTIYNNTILDADYGISIRYGINHNISSNYVENVVTGIYLRDLNYTIVANNIILLSESGIYTDGVNHFIIKSNTLTNLESDGIEIIGSINGSITGNFMAHNEIGFFGSQGVENITVWLNYFYNHSYSEASTGPGVSFDNGSMGNYWGDYGSRYPDANTTDGIIWDTQYQINDTSYNDTYPLVSPGNPSVAPSNNITYMEGDLGNSISWNVTDPNVLETSFSVFRNNLPVRTGAWNSRIPIEVDVDGLEAGNHTFSIEISDGTAWGVNRSEIMVTVDEVPSPVITNSSQIILGQNFTLGWSSVYEADSYKIYVNGSLNETSISTSQLIMLWTIGAYSITVTTVNGGAESIQSSPIEVTVAILSTPIISTMDQTIISESITVSWGAVTWAESYNVYVNGYLNETATTTSKLIMLWANGSYSITVTAINGSFQSDQSLPVMITAEILIPPTITTANKTIMSETINISWSAVSGAVSYKIYVNNVINETTTNTSVIVNLLTNGNYSITVTAVNGSIETAHSSAIMIIVELGGDYTSNPLDGLYVSLITFFAVGFVFFLSLKGRKAG